MNRLKLYRLQMNLTQSEVAEKLKLAKNTICQYESGKRKPSIKIVYSLAKVLSLKPEEILECFKNEN